MTKTKKLQLAGHGCFKSRPCLLIFWLGLCLSLRIGPTSLMGEDYNDAVRQHLQMQSEGLAKAMAQLDESDPNLAQLKQALIKEIEMLPQGRKVTPPEAKPTRNGMLYALMPPVATLVAVGAIGLFLKRRFTSGPEEMAIEERIAALLAKNSAMPEALNELRDGFERPAATQRKSKEPTQGANMAPSVEPLKVYLATVPDLLSKLRTFLGELSRNVETGVAIETIQQFHGVMAGLKSELRSSELRPIWLMVSAVEGLLKQLSKSPAELTPSVIQTVAGAVDLLEKLSVRDLNPELASDPPVKLLAVDDDAVSRLAISFALKHAFKAPDLAPDGESALRLVAEETYDVIFLDVDMPGMDGYELCQRIHQTDHHRNTPVVFVTRHTEFVSRAKSKLVGGDGVIGKPYLTFEITVKALTLALRNRLRTSVSAKHTETDARPGTAGVQTKAVAEDGGTNRVARPQTATESRNAPQSSQAVPDCGSTKSVEKLAGSGSTEPAAEPGRRASNQISLLRDVAMTLSPSDNDSVSARKLGEIQSRLHSVTAVSGMPSSKDPISRLTVCLSGLIQKLLDKRNNRTPSALSTVRTAIELLHELVVDGGAHELSVVQSFRMLVVDDDPISRRSMACALQMAFDKPECVEDGEAALTAAEKKTYDVIFLDVQMPGMDGFEVCTKLRLGAQNAGTPVVFVTSHGDAETREQSKSSGADDFIQKPFLTSEVTVKAMTFALRNRFAKLQIA